MPRIVLFSKPFGPRPAPEVAEMMAAMGVDGVDLVIRDGLILGPHDLDHLPGVVSAFAARDLEVAIASTDLIQAGPAAEAVLGACAQAGIPLLRVGFFGYDPAAGYHAGAEGARRQLELMTEIAARVGIRVLLQVHHGTVHPSSALTMGLVEGLDPAHMGIYADFGNQARGGYEDWSLALDLIARRTACVGVKNAAWKLVGRDPEGQSRWAQQWVELPDGIVPWPSILASMAARGCADLLSLHALYEGSFEEVMTRARDDLAYLRRAIKSFSTEPAPGR